MFYIRTFHSENKIVFEVKSSYIDDGGYTFSQMMSLGFKWFKLSRMYSKTYLQKEYILDRFQTDLDKIKQLAKHYKIESFKLTNEEKSYVSK